LNIVLPGRRCGCEFIKGYEGVIQTDGYKGYDFIDHIKEILHMGCCHGVVNSLPSRNRGKTCRATKTTITGQALKYIRSFMAWRQAKEKGLTGDGSRERREKATR
jgi:transposase